MESAEGSLNNCANQDVAEEPLCKLCRVCELQMFVNFAEETAADIGVIRALFVWSDKVFGAVTISLWWSKLF